METQCETTKSMKNNERGKKILKTMKHNESQEKPRKNYHWNVNLILDRKNVSQKCILEMYYFSWNAGLTLNFSKLQIITYQIPY